MTIKQTRAPRKTKIAEVIDAPVKRSAFRQAMIDLDLPNTSAKRYVVSLLVSLLSGYALGSYVVGPAMAAFTIGALALGWPLLIVLLGYIILMTMALYHCGSLCGYLGDLVLMKKLDAMYFVARDKVRGLFNFSKEVTS